MQRPRLPTRLCVPLLAGYVLLGLSGREGLVLCIGAHGHVALEAEAHHPCTPHANERPSCEPALDTETCQCAPCVDIPLAAASDAGLPAKDRSGRKSSLPNGAPFAASLPAAAGFDPVRAPPAFEPPLASPVHASLRSVVLLL